MRLARSPAAVVAAARHVGRSPLGPRRALLGAITVYQRVVSPWFGPVCRFHPSCSCYGYEAVERHGVVRGLALLVWRLLRCHPFHPGGVDPVPQGPRRALGRRESGEP